MPRAQPGRASVVPRSLAGSTRREDASSTARCRAVALESDMLRGWPPEAAAICSRTSNSGSKRLGPRPCRSRRRPGGRRARGPRRPTRCRQLADVGLGGGRVAAVVCAVVVGAARAEAERARVQRLAHQRAHLRDVLVGRRLGRHGRSPITKTRRASCGTWSANRSCAGGGRARPCTRGSSPTQVMPSESAVPGMSSTPCMSAMRRTRSRGAHGREADAAVAQDRGRDAVVARGEQLRVPRDCPS
jgi:hypothetical protein